MTRSVWWGRELDEMERATSLAELRAQLRARGETADVREIDGPRRWLRGRIQQTDAGFEVEVNSKERFERFLELLRELGEKPAVSDKLIIDPAQDMPQLRSGSMIPFAASEESNAAWAAHWPDQQVPALSGQTPRRAARRVADQPRLEALLRELRNTTPTCSPAAGCRCQTSEHLRTGTGDARGHTHGDDIQEEPRAPATGWRLALVRECGRGGRDAFHACPSSGAGVLRWTHQAPALVRGATVGAAQGARFAPVASPATDSPGRANTRRSTWPGPRLPANLQAATRPSWLRWSPVGVVS